MRVALNRPDEAATSLPILSVALQGRVDGGAFDQRFHIILTAKESLTTPPPLNI